ncbi:MAG TPA: glycosyltransferase family 39 protein, partial [Anaerolineae bacterium]
MRIHLNSNRAPTRTLYYLVGILIISVVLRLAAALVMGNTIDSLPGIVDQISYHTLALQVISGHGFTMPTDWWPLTRAGQPTAHWSYLYTLYLAAVYSLFGASPLIARVLQVMIVGVAWPLLVWRLARRLAGNGVGLIAAAWTALYGYFIYYSAALMTESFYITAILWAFDLVMNADPKHPYRRWALIGLASGVAALLRQSFLVFLPFMLLWAWAEEVERARLEKGGSVNILQGYTPVQRIRAFIADAFQVIRLPILATLVVILMILPWTIRNNIAFGRFVLLNTNAGYAFFFANHPIYGTEFVSILPADITYQSLVPPELRSLDEAALDSALLKLGMSYVTQDPVRYALLSLSRVKSFFMFWPSSDSGL